MCVFVQLVGYNISAYFPYFCLMIFFYSNSGKQNLGQNNWMTNAFQKSVHVI